VLADQVYGFLSEFLTQKQCEVVILYFIYQKTQQEVAEVLGISHRVVSQHLFGICLPPTHLWMLPLSISQRLPEI